MRIMNTTNHPMSGKQGDTVYYVMNGKMYARSARDPHIKWQATPKRKQMNGRFRAIQQIYSYYRKNVSPDIWKIAAQEEGKMASNLFHSTNCNCFDSEGKLADPAGFSFTAGSLMLPRNLRIEAAADNGFHVFWEEERELTTAAAADRLQVGIIEKPEALSFKLVREVQGQRSEQCGFFRLPHTCKGEVHVYLFFTREDGSACSPSRYFRVDTEKQPI